MIQRCEWILIVLLMGMVACHSSGDSTGENSDTDVEDRDGQVDTNSGLDGNTDSDSATLTDSDTGPEPDTGTVVDTDPDLAISPLLRPFDANRRDTNAVLQNWNARYGKTPEIIVASTGTELHVLAQDYDEETEWAAVLLQIKFNGERYQVTGAMTDIPMLDRVMGLSVDDHGNRYYATGVDEGSAVDSAYPPLDTWRSDIVRVVKLDSSGDVLFNVDLDTARYAFDDRAEPIINPMTAATARLQVGGNELALVHGNNTNPDWNIEGRRHQKALSTRLDATTGEITRISSGWVSHSFDQRLLYDGSGIIEYHLGDAYPRYLVFCKNHRNEPAFHIKGALGANETHTRLGNLALIEDDPEFGYIALFSTENNDITSETINGARNLGMVRIHRDDSSVDSALPDTLEVNSSGTSRTNRLRWLTTYSDASGRHVERPKLVGLGADRYIVLWEEWERENPNVFHGVFGLLMDAHGNVLVETQLITGDHHLHRGDDAFFLSGRAGWITGDEVDRSLTIHLVDESLHYEAFVLP